LIVNTTGGQVMSWPDVVTVWPSLNVTHLHFEVRSPGKVGVPNANHENGEMNPHDFLFLPFGGR
jgi:hypothetical protein